MGSVLCFRTSCTASMFTFGGACTCKTCFQVHSACRLCRVLDSQPGVSLLPPGRGAQSQGQLCLSHNLPGSVGPLRVHMRAHTHTHCSALHTPSNRTLTSQCSQCTAVCLLVMCLCLSPAFSAPSHPSSHSLRGALPEFLVCVTLVCSL